MTRERGLGVRFRVRTSCERRGKKAKREESVPTGRRELQVLFFAIDQVACGLISGAGSTLFVTRQETIGFWVF